MDPMGIIYIYSKPGPPLFIQGCSHLQGRQFRELGRWTPSQGIQTAQRGHLWRRRLKGRIFFFSWLEKTNTSYIILYHPTSSYIILYHPQVMLISTTLLWRLHFVICCLHGTETACEKNIGLHRAQSNKDFHAPERKNLELSATML